MQLQPEHLDEFYMLLQLVEVKARLVSIKVHFPVADDVFLFSHKICLNAYGYYC